MKGRLTKAKGTDRLFATIKARREPCRARALHVCDRPTCAAQRIFPQETHYRTTALLETPDLDAAVVLPRVIPDAACSVRRSAWDVQDAPLSADHCTRRDALAVPVACRDACACSSRESRRRCWIVEPSPDADADVGGASPSLALRVGLSLRCVRTLPHSMRLSVNAPTSAPGLGSPLPRTSG
jgi:hypothetical protein